MMKNNFLIECPINKLSLGQFSYNILRQIFQQGLSPCIVPIGNVDLSAFIPDESFNTWLKFNIEKTHKHHKRKNPALKIWHLNGSLSSWSEKQVLYTFHELDQCTDNEINVVNNQAATIFSSEYSKKTFDLFGAENTYNIPLGFDDRHFYKVDLSSKKNTNVIEWGLSGKFERRKHHAKIIELWCKLYAGNAGHRLNLATTNPFLTSEQYQGLLHQLFSGNKPWNINITQYMDKNEDYNRFLNYIDIDLTGLSGAEGFNVPPFQSVALEKQVIVLNATGHKEWADEENSILVEPNGKVPATDGIFFGDHNSPYNIGNIYTFDDQAVISAMKLAEDRVRNGVINQAGAKLRSRTYDYTWNRIFEILKQFE